MGVGGGVSHQHSMLEVLVEDGGSIVRGYEVIYMMKKLRKEPIPDSKALVDCRDSEG